MNHSVVKNAASAKQVKKAKSAEKRNETEAIDDLRFILKTHQGRNVLWKIMTDCKVFNHIWEPSAKIHYNAGQQALGQKLMADIVEAGEEYLFLMMKENYKGKGDLSA